MAKHFKFFNLFTIIFIFLLCFLYNNSQYIHGHDFFWPYYIDLKTMNSPADPRIIPMIIDNLYNDFFPKLLNMHLVDFRTNFIVCSLPSILYMIICALFSMGFYIFSKKTNYIGRKENILIMLLSFLILSSPMIIKLSDYSSEPINIYLLNKVFCGSIDSSVYLEHCAGYLFYIPFFIVLFKIIMQDKNFNKFEFFLFPFIALILGLWSEFINLPIFFSILLIILILILSTNLRYKLKNPSLILLFTSFIAGFFFFYYFGHFNLNTIGSIGSYDIIGRLHENINNISVFNKSFAEYMFYKPKYLWILISISIFIIFVVPIKFFDSISVDNKYNKFQIILLSLSPIAGFLFANYMSIFIQNYREGNDPYIFQMPYFHIMEFHILYFVLLILLGIIYFSSNIKVKSVINAYIIFSILFMSVYFLPMYFEIIKYKYNYRNEMYRLEKAFITYSIFGESPVISSKIFENNDFRIDNRDINKYIQNFSMGINVYLKNHYKHNYNGIVTAEDETYVNNELQKRLKYIDIKDKYDIFRQVKFGTLKKLDNINLSLKDIDSFETKYGKDDVLLKAKAYLYFKEKDYEKALDLYLQYLQNKPDDFDALINLGAIYKEQGKYDSAVDMYSKLLNLDSNNIFFMFETADCYYKKGDYNKALDYIFKIHNIIPDNNNINFDIALIYKQLKEKDKAEQFIKLTDKNSDDFYNDENDILIKPYE